MKPSLPQGTRDFDAATIRKRGYIFSTIRNVFECYGFEPLETPAMENLETLTGKYGDEGDKLIFKILNNGLSDPKNSEKAKAAFDRVLEGRSDKQLTERALRYDLTIPFARYVAMNHTQLTFPFRRYQMQPVWRADRPQKGRYREFYQCDADIVGSVSSLNEIELAAIYANVFKELKIDVEIKLNSRKILTALAERIGEPDQLVPITVAIDKLDKIGLDKVLEELQQKGLQADQLSIISAYLSISGANDKKLKAVELLLEHAATAQKGIAELAAVLDAHSTSNNIVVDFTLARGLNYYTGIIFEVKATGVSIGSIGGGGRYDDLTGLFGVPNIPGVGISFGVDRIYDVMEELKLFPATLTTGTQVLFFNLGVSESALAFSLMQQLRNKHISCELFHEPAKFEKQFKYAEKKQIRYAVIIGDKELSDGSCTVRNLQTKQQESISQETLVSYHFQR